MSGDDYLISTLTVCSVTCSFSHHFYFVIPTLIGNDKKKNSTDCPRKSSAISSHGPVGTCIVHWLWVCSAHNSTTVAYICLPIFLCSLISPCVATILLFRPDHSCQSVNYKSERDLVFIYIFKQTVSHDKQQ